MQLIIQMLVFQFIYYTRRYQDPLEIPTRIQELLKGINLWDVDVIRASKHFPGFSINFLMWFIRLAIQYDFFDHSYE